MADQIAPPPRRILLRHRLEAGLVHALFWLARIAGPDRASAIGGCIARFVGPRLGTSKRARRNLERFMPELDAAARERIVAEVWENLGRTAAEYPHIAYLAANRVEVIGMEHGVAAHARGKSIIFIAGHLANWEILPPIARAHGLSLHVVYRALNNPLVDALITRCRGEGAASAIPKGFDGAKRVMKLISLHEHFGMLLDQKQNDGIAVPFFGAPAMTTPVPAIFAQRFGVALLPIQIERLNGARFRVTVHPMIETPDSGDRNADTLAIMTAVNARIESWVRRNPGQWLWLHKRWPNA